MDTHGKRWTKRRIVRKGTDSAYAPVIGERGSHITIVASVCADGTVVPPTVILPGSGNLSEPELRQYPEGTTVTNTNNGWSNSTVFLSVLKSIVGHTAKEHPHWARQTVRARKPILIFVDGHSSHDGIKILRYCRKQKIEILVSPAHCTHVLQVLDSHLLFGAFQSKLRKYIQESSENGVPIEVQTFGRPFRRAFEDVFEDSSRIKSAFRSKGIFPFNPQALDVAKLRQHAAIQEAEEYKKCRAKGMHHDAATAAARTAMTTPPNEYHEQWQRDIVDYFVEQVQQPVEEEVSSVREMVNRSVVEVQQRAFDQAQLHATVVDTVKRKRRKKALNHQAAILTNPERFAAAEEKETQLLAEEALNNRKQVYKAEYKIKMKRYKELVKENKVPLKNAKKRLKITEAALKKAKTALKKVKKPVGVPAADVPSLWLTCAVLSRRNAPAMPKMLFKPQLSKWHCWKQM